MKFGLMFFAASEDSLGADTYRLVVDSARFGDSEGFSSVWVPERHFTAFGGPYPNPAVLHAGLATCTSSIRLQAGSVVAPLHHPLRIAEEWSVVDNLSNGRVGLSFASGWNPEDFVFFPDYYADRHERVFDTMREVQRLWRGETFEGTSGVGKPARVRIFPRPVQRELPVWLTVAGNPKHFERAGASGANLLTHLLDQDESVLASRIALYREARAAAGFDPATGVVSLMIHTFVGAEADTVREQARRPYCNYIKANIGLFKGLAQSRGHEVDLSAMSPADLDEFTNFLYDRFAASRGLIGTPESCAPLVARLEAVGVDELACLLDFGPDVDLILANLPQLARLKTLHASTTTTRFDRERIQQRCTETMTGDELHQALARHAVQIDGAFRAIDRVWRRDGEALARLRLAPAGDGYHVHPASLDACGRVLAATLPELGQRGADSYIPSGVDACDIHGALTGDVWVHATITDRATGPSPSVTGNVDVYDASGGVLARLSGLALTPVRSHAATDDISGLLYERTWHESSDEPGRTVDVQGRWLIVGDRGDVGSALGRELERLGAECVTTAGERDLRGIVYLRGLDAAAGADAGTAAVASDVEHAVREALAIAQRRASAPIWIVTRGAVAVRPGEDVVPAQAPLWGFGRALAVERQGAWGALVDLDPAASADDAARMLVQALGGERTDDMVAFREAARFVPRLRRAADVAAARPAPAWTADDTILITGGTGGLGMRLAAWAVDRGARHLLLCGRRAPGSPVEAEIARLRASGIDIVAVQADVADETAFAAAVDDALASRPAVTSLFHLAGVLDDGDVDGQTWERFARVFAAKVAGSWTLHRLSARWPIEHFVLFSSISSLVPAPGQSSYAAANAFLDALAAHRRARGLPALVVNWGPWSDAGHAESEYGRRAHERLRAMGIGSISPDDGLRVLDTLMQEDRTQAAAVSVDWPRLFETDPAAARLGLLADLVERSEGSAAMHRRPSELVDTLTALAVPERRPFLMSYLSDLVSAALKLRTDTPIDARQRLFDLGVDSILALELKDRLERALGVGLSATLLFVRPTLEALCDYILDEIVPATPAPAVAAAATAAAAPALHDAMTEEELTRLLLQEIDASRGA
jgi:natural product biosynthesis luciferase-like monooxygenase protein